MSSDTSALDGSPIIDYSKRMSYGETNGASPREGTRPPTLPPHRRTAANIINNASENMYTGHILEGITQFYGTVLSVQDISGDNAASAGGNSFLEFMRNSDDNLGNRHVIRVRIPELSPAAIEPSVVSENPSPQDQFRMEFGYLEFVSESPGGETPQVGDIARFRYDQSSGVATFLGTTGTNVNGQSRSVGSSSGAFNAGSSSLLGTSTNPEYRTSGQLVPTSIAEAGRLEGLASRIGIPYPVLLAIRSVESGGNSSAIRFEPHIFLSERYDFGRPDLASVIPYNPGGNDAAPSVDYTSANTGLEALRNAMEHDAVAAVQSTSWGSFQVMGFNFSSGAPSEIIRNAIASDAGARAFYEAFFEDPVAISDEILAGWFSGKPDVIAACNTYDWRTIATRYNGGGCCGEGSREYDVKMATRYEQALEQGATA